MFFFLFFFFFCNKYLLNDSGKLGWGQPILFEKNEREYRLCTPPCKLWSLAFDASPDQDKQT
jgi:hypothetical protein